MSSILTNNSAMVALQTLKAVNTNLQTVQGEISTGKSVASAKDNAAVWAISKVMESDVKGFQAISDSLGLGESSVALARNAAESVTDLLIEIKGKIVDSQEENVDRNKIQDDIDALRDQINSVVGAAQFNGLNLVSGTEDVKILSSLDRSGSNTVNASNITINRQDLGTAAGTNGVGTGGTDLSGQILDAASGSAYGGGTLSANGNTAVIEFAQTTGWDAGDATTINIAGLSVTYTSAAADQTETQARDALLTSLQALDLEDVTFTSGGADQIVVTSTRSFDSLDIAISDSVTGGDGNAYIQEINGVATGNTTTETGTVEQRAEEIFFATSAVVAEGNSYQASVGGQLISIPLAKARPLKMLHAA
ncbi:flagellin [Fontisubflavum oceani]|uniref:flagellin N-terminal helical domain-containing protein n=1 Tax=Fontisubflavum oceani TaxID=2978973 RepID=UPI0025B3C092|nr:flagellin [Fontisubflavum oceani]WJY22710.1 flagellin [Fontisubflavum oceani]